MPENYIYDENNNLIGKGHYSKVYNIKLKNSSNLYAMKVDENKRNCICNEISIIGSLKGIEGIPKLIGHSIESIKKISIQNLLGPSLDKLHWFCNFAFSDITIIDIGINIIKILEKVHNNGVIHRDIKPQNICYGEFTSKKKMVNKALYLIDFGLGKKMLKYNFRKKILNKVERFTGSLLFASSSALSGFDQNPKDDLESLFYVLAYLKNGYLPWFKHQDKELQIFVKEMIKMKDVSFADILFKGFPKEIKFVYKSIKNLSPFEKPEYEIYINILEIAKYKLKEGNNIKEEKYDWEVKLEEIFNKYKSLNVSVEELTKIAFLMEGYQISIEEFLKFYKTK